MGMFDWVAFWMPCPRCGERVSGFQSKSGDCDLRVVLPHTVDNFYSRCEKCDTHVEFTDGKQVRPVYDTGAEMLPIPPDGRVYSREDYPS